MKTLKNRILQDGRCLPGGIHVESLAIIESLDNCEIKFQ